MEVYAIHSLDRQLNESDSDRRDHQRSRSRETTRSAAKEKEAERMTTALPVNVTIKTRERGVVRRTSVRRSNMSVRLGYLQKVGINPGAAQQKFTSISSLMKSPERLSKVVEHMRNGYVVSKTTRVDKTSASRQSMVPVPGIEVQEINRDGKTYRKVFIAREAVSWMVSYCKRNRIVVERQLMFSSHDDDQDLEEDDSLDVHWATATRERKASASGDRVVYRAVGRQDAVSLLQVLQKAKLFDFVTGLGSGRMHHEPSESMDCEPLYVCLGYACIAAYFCIVVSIVPVLWHARSQFHT